MTHATRDRTAPWHAGAAQFLGGLAEGTETIVVHSLWLVLTAHAAVIATGWAVAVALSAAQRIVAGFRDLS